MVVGGAARIHQPVGRTRFVVDGKGMSTSRRDGYLGIKVDVAATRDCERNDPLGRTVESRSGSCQLESHPVDHVEACETQVTDA